MLAIPHTLSRGWRTTLLVLAGLVSSAVSTYAANPDTAVPLVVGNRTIHTFREPLGDISATEREVAARRHIEQALDIPGEGWTSIIPAEKSVLVALDGQLMFTVSPGDARKESGETPESMANVASKELQKVWAEARERRQTCFNGAAWLRVTAALAVLVLGLVAVFKANRFLRQLLLGQLAGWLKSQSQSGLGSRLSGVILRICSNLLALALWLAGLLGMLLFTAYALDQFPTTRPFSDNLRQTLSEAVFNGVSASLEALPGIFVAAVIFALVRVVTLLTRALFDNIADGRWQWGMLDAHTALATRYLVNAALWLFAVAMAYPYLPGSHTEAFKGLSVLIGVMVSIGAAGPVGQIASGLILVFTRAMLVGEYVRIHEHEGTVTQLGLCVTRLRTGAGEEIALPNSVVMGNVTRNFSRHAQDGGQVVETSVTIGYDTPWRQVHALLLAAAGAVPTVRKEPAPFVAQTALSDYYVEYRLVVQADLKENATRLTLLSELNAAIQDAFNRAGVQIMSPHYLGDPATAKVVPEARWHQPPAR